MNMLRTTTIPARIVQAPDDGSGNMLGGLGDIGGSDNGIGAASDVFRQELDREMGQQSEAEDEDDQGGDDDDDRRRSDQSEDDDDADDDADSDDDDDADSDDDGSEDSDDDDDAGSDDKAQHKVKINGEEQDVTLDELKKGYSRQADYTRKQQQLAERNREIDSHEQQVSGLADQYKEKLKQAEDVLQALGRKPDSYWEQLSQSDPDRYAREAEQDRQRQRDMELIRQERENADEQKKRLSQQEQQRRQRREQENMAILLPEWSDADTKQQDIQRIAGYAGNLGFTNDELNSIADSRQVKVLRDAAKWQELQQKQSSGKKRGNSDKGEESGRKRKSSTAKPGKPKRQSRNQSKSKKAQSRLRKSGSLRDAADVFSQMDD